MCTWARRVSLVTLVVAGVALAQAVDDVPALRCPNDVTEDQCLQDSRETNIFWVEGDATTVIYMVDDNLLMLKCLMLSLTQTLRWLPRFTPALHVGKVTVVQCPPTHYATMLAALNITLTSPFYLQLIDMENKQFDAAHFTGLPPVHHLMIQRAGVLRGLPASLEVLTMEYMHLLDDTLEALPHTLTELRLERVNVTRVPAAVLELPELRSLHVDWSSFLGRRVEELQVDRTTTSRLRQLYVDGADAALMSEWAPPALEEVTLQYWRAQRPNPIPACDKLGTVTLIYPEVKEFPAGWVARCPRLEVLHITSAYALRELPAGLLEIAPHLTTFGIESTSLTSLPAQLFAHTPHLRHLNLRHNKFKELPSAILTLPLLSLHLAGNVLDTSVATELVTLSDADNVPEYKWKSSMASLLHLERLDLSYTDISVICSDWREDMVNLTYLDLRYTNIRNLKYEDLQYRRHVPAVVKVSGTMNFTADDYDRAAGAAAVAAPSRYVTLIISTKTIYDCNLYWLTKALNDGLLPLYDVQLNHKPSQRTVRAEGLLCPSKEICATVPSSCDCGTAGGGLLRVVCVGVKLDHVPRLPSLDNHTDVHAVDLVLSDNSITELVADDLPPHLRVLDLRNNSISYMTEATARALVSGPKRRVLLAGNPLECSCRATPALRVLRDHAAALVGYDSLRCEDGGMLEDAIDACWKLVVTASLPSVTAASLALYLWWKGRSVLGHSRALLWRLGWRSRDEHDAEWPWDAFVLFGRGDEALALEVTARLERRPRRVCLAERDWLPPARLSECIARSARGARRTVALVSRQCERSLEADEVQATSRRGALVLVLAPDEDLQDATLRRYAASYPHMVLRRDAPDFWCRLERAVPLSPASSKPSPGYTPSVPLTPHR